MDSLKRERGCREVGVGVGMSTRGERTDSVGIKARSSGRVAKTLSSPELEDTSSLLDIKKRLASSHGAHL